VRLRRIVENSLGVLYYNSLKALYWDFDRYVHRPADFRSRLASFCARVSEEFSEHYNVTLSCRLLRLEGPFELGEVPQRYVCAKGYAAGSTCFEAVFECRANDSVAITRRRRSYLLCHPYRYFRLLRAVEGLGEALARAGSCNSTDLLRIAQSYLDNRLEGFVYSVRLSA